MGLFLDSVMNYGSGAEGGQSFWIACGESAQFRGKLSRDVCSSTLHSLVFSLKYIHLMGWYLNYNDQHVSRHL